MKRTEFEKANISIHQLAPLIFSYKEHIIERMKIVPILPFVAAIVYLVGIKGVLWKVLILGSGSWGVGCIAKMILYHLVVRRLSHEGKNLRWVAALQGMISGITEIGAAVAFFLLFRPLEFLEVVAFGAGIGAIEALLVVTPGSPLKGTALEKAALERDRAVKNLPRRQQIIHDELASTIERMIAGAIHVGTRGLTYVAVASGIYGILAFPIAVFLAADGIGYFKGFRGHFKNPALVWHFYVFLAAVATFTVFLFIWLWAEIPRP